MSAESHIYTLNSELRDLVEQNLQEGNKDVVAQIKATVKSLEDAGLYDTLNETKQFSIVATMFYCYIEPVSKLVNQKA